MQYLLLIYENEQVWASKSTAEQERVIQGHMALGERLRADGVNWSGNPLLPTSTAMTVRVRGGVKQVTDGPFAETKEQLSGYYLVDVPGLDKALEYAALIPDAATGTIEVRPVATPEEMVQG